MQLEENRPGKCLLHIFHSARKQCQTLSVHLASSWISTWRSGWRKEAESTGSNPLALHIHNIYSATSAPDTAPANSPSGRSRWSSTLRFCFSGLQMSIDKFRRSNSATAVTAKLWKMVPPKASHGRGSQKGRGSAAYIIEAVWEVYFVQWNLSCILVLREKWIFIPCRFDFFFILASVTSVMRWKLLWRTS